MLSRSTLWPTVAHRGKGFLGLGRSAGSSSRDAAGEKRGRRPSTLRWWLLGFLLGAAIYLARPRAGAPGVGPVFWAFFAFTVGVIGLLAVLVLLLLVRPRHERVTFALRMARSGRVDWAIADIQRQIERRGPSPERSGALGDCYLLREEWRQAYIHYLDAERIDGRKGRYLAKQGFALWKLGRAEEATALLEHASALEPLNPSHAWTSCLILADLGRYDEAGEQLHRAERLLENGGPLDDARRRALKDSIEVCRKRLSERPSPGPPTEPPVEPS